MIDLPPPPSYEQTVQAIIQCGVSQTNIHIEYVDEYQSHVVAIRDLGDVTEEKLRCLGEAVHSSYILEIEDKRQRAAFDEFFMREYRPKAKADAIEWLRSKGLLPRLPNFDPQQDVKQFAEALETACGAKPGSALMLWDHTAISVRPDFILGADFHAVAENYTCLYNMFAASDADQHGVHFVIIGNEAIAQEKQK